MRVLSKITIAVFAILLLSTAYAFQSTDYTCMNDCSSNGYMYQYCQSRCSYDNAPQMPKRTDYTCVSNCTDKGYMYSYCQQACSY